MFDFILNILKNLSKSIGNGLSWIWTYMVPQKVKDKLTDQLGQFSLAQMFLFVFQIFTYWYFYMAIAGIVVTYYLFKALKDTGVLERFQEIVETTVGTVFFIAQECFPLITDLNQMMDCIGAA